MHYFINQSKAEAIRRFFGLLTHSKGLTAGTRFDLTEWQDKFVTELLATEDEDGNRQYRQAFLAIPRKNGKSTLVAALGLFLLLADGQAKPEIVCAAASREQARLIFTCCTEFIESSPVLSSLCTVYRNEIRTKEGGILKTIAAEARTSHGLNPTAILIDEFHAQSGREFYDVLATSVGARPNPLLILITTAGVEQTSICRELWTYAEQVRDSVIEDNSFYPLIFAADPKDDPFSEETWEKANPNLGISLSLDYMKDAAKRAKQEPGALSSFLTLHLNLWVSSKEKWITLENWDQCKEQEFIELEGLDCFGGLDLASTHDLASFSLVFPIGDKYHVRHWSWIPLERMTERIRKDKVPYDVWLRDGFLKATEGNVIDFDTIIADIEEIATRYKIKQVAFDRYGATQVSNKLIDAGLELFSMGQGFVSMGMPTSEFGRLIASQKIQHNGDPVLRWAVDNLTLERDAAGNLKPSKAKARQKIDPVVASIMALDRSLRNRPVESVYSKRGIREI